MVGSLLDELERLEAAARAEAEELRGRIAELTEFLARAKERLARLVITRETVEVAQDAGRPVRAAQIAAAGLSTERGKAESLRGKLKRLVERGWLAEDGPGLFSLPARGGAEENRG